MIYTTALNGSFRNVSAYWTEAYLFQSEIWAQWLSAVALKPLLCFAWTLPEELHVPFPLTWHSPYLLNNWWKHTIVKNVYCSVLMGIAIKGEGQKYVILHKKQHNCILQRCLTTNYEIHAVEKLSGFLCIFLLLLCLMWWMFVWKQEVKFCSGISINLKFSSYSKQIAL